MDFHWQLEGSSGGDAQFLGTVAAWADEEGMSALHLATLMGVGVGEARALLAQDWSPIGSAREMLRAVMGMPRGTAAGFLRGRA